LAQGDAASLLALLTLPPGSSPSVGEPAGDRGLLAHPSLSVATPNLVDQHTWWVVPLGRAQAIAFFASHPPSGSIPSESGNGGTGHVVRNGEQEVGNVEYEWQGFRFPPVQGALGRRSLVVTAVQLPNGSSGVRIDAQVVWLTPRPAAEVIPSGARRMSVAVLSEIPANRSNQRPFTMVSSRRIAAVVKVLNALAAVQPGTTNCRADFGNLVRLVFRTRPAASPQAVVTIDPTGCGRVGVVIGGKVEHALQSEGNLVGQISHILGVKIRAAPRH
jgi:hypothetical protein